MRGLLPLLAIAVILLGPRPAKRLRVLTQPAERYDVSTALASMPSGDAGIAASDCRACDAPPEDDADQAVVAPAPMPHIPPAGAAVEQRTPGDRPPVKLVASFDGLGAGFEGPQGPAAGRNPSDNSLAVGPNHIVQIVNSRMAVFDKTGKPLYGAVPTNTIFKGFGGVCEQRNNGDAVVRYDQLAGRWLYVMPIFSRIADRPDTPYSMCYAVSTGADPLGPYYRYEFRRKLFPDYPRPAVWPDGYYVPTSTGDEVIQKHVCIAERAKMLTGGAAAEQCIVIDGVNFLNNADIDGPGLPPAGAPNLMMAAGGTQLRKTFEDDGMYFWKVHVDWETPAKTTADGPHKIAVAPYHYLCDGQLTNCVPQPGVERRLDAQGDKIMQRLVYRNIGGRESLVVQHSVNTAAGGGGVRWYEFRLTRNGDPALYQQGVYAPDARYRWMASAGMDREGNIGIGYSFGGPADFAGQRFTARLASDAPGVLPFGETVLAEGEAAQTNTLRWEDYTTTAMDPSDDCTFWYVGDYLKKGAASYSTRIGAFRLPGCLRASVAGIGFPKHRRLTYESGSVITDAKGAFTISLPADPAYAEPSYTFHDTRSKRAWTVHLRAGETARIEYRSVP